MYACTKTNPSNNINSEAKLLRYGRSYSVTRYLRQRNPKNQCEPIQKHPIEPTPGAASPVIREAHMEESECTRSFCFPGWQKKKKKKKTWNVLWKGRILQHQKEDNFW